MLWILSDRRAKEHITHNGLQGATGWGLWWFEECFKERRGITNVVWQTNGTDQGDGDQVWQSCFPM